MPRFGAKTLVRRLQIVVAIVLIAESALPTHQSASAQPSSDNDNVHIFLPLIMGGGQADDASVVVPVSTNDVWDEIVEVVDRDNEADPNSTETPALENFANYIFLPNVQNDQEDLYAAASTPAPDNIFADGFETGNLSAWTASANSGNLGVATGAALVGSQGLQVTINSNTATYLTDDRPNREPRYRTRFYFDPNSIKMASGNSHYIFYGYVGTSTVVLRVQLQFTGSNYQLRTAFVNNSDTWTTSSWFTIADAPHFIELDWNAATAGGAKNGSLTLWIDGVQKASFTKGDNNTRRIDRVRLGSVSGIDSGTRGAYYFDAFESRRQTYIGPANNGPAPTVTPTSTPVPPTPMPTPTAPSTSTPVPPTMTPTPTAPPAPYPGSDPAIMAAGDIICTGMSTPSSTSCAHTVVSQIMMNQLPTAVLTIGDNCHDPTSACYSDYYGPSWGRFKSITRPMSGNHDYLVTNASPYYDYFNGAGNFSGPAGDRDKGYYSFDIGKWHVIALNTQCSQIGGCSAGSPQYVWLENDLRTHPAGCTLAYYHIPLFSSGGRANQNSLALYTLLYNYNSEIVLNGHDHIYERFAPQKYDGTLDTLRGIREFIVGTGGANHTSIAAIQTNSEVRNVDTFGVIKLTLHPDRYDWQFVPVAGKTFTDSGTTLCH